MTPQDRILAIRSSKLEPSMRLLLVMIASHMHDERMTCWVGEDTLAEETGLSSSTVRALLKQAVALGVLRRWQGDHRAKDMDIEWAALSAAAPPTNRRGGIRKGANIAPHPPNIAPHPPITGGSDNRQVGERTSAGWGAITGRLGSEHRPRTGSEPDHEPDLEPVTPLPPAGGPAVAGDTPGLQPWLPKDTRPHPRPAVQALVLVAVQAITQADVNPARCKGHAAAILALWTGLQRPDPEVFAAEIALVAEWAREAPDRLAARDIRAEGWADGVDRRHEVSTITVQKSWESRLRAAKAWADRGKPTAPEPTPNGRAPPGRTSPYRRTTDMFGEPVADPPTHTHGVVLDVKEAE